ncbi:hypothetical protein MmTuc01_1305 [Methanosarcina mazei Tuc01]|uniref:Uncharacterized protein n=1 Tax=Methanosarcina mazei Tuc01 TaxID=1236903 RepID=M1PWR2_METMZ|nr:hypothetical protein MmTuc01_1305 [Methanosarcina mazei Tuc01]
MDSSFAGFVMIRELTLLINFILFSNHPNIKSLMEKLIYYNR